MQPQRYYSPFSKGYWEVAFRQLSSVKMLVIAALFVALRFVVGSFFVVLPATANLRVYFTFTVVSLGASIYGPVLGLIDGLVSDLIGCLIRPSGPFFAGYTLSAMLSSFVFALFLFRAPKITWLRVAGSKFVVNVFINALLGSVWSAMIQGNVFWFYFGQSIIKNLVLLPFEVVVMMALFKVCTPIFNRYV